MIKSLSSVIVNKNKKEIKDMTNITKFTNTLDMGDDVESLPQIEIEEIDVIFNDNIDDDITDDYKYSRQKLMYAMTASEAVMKHALRDMSDNPGPRSVEAFSTLLKVTNEVCEKIFSLHEKMKKINPKKEQPVLDDDDKPKTMRATINDIISNLPNT